MEPAWLAAAKAELGVVEYAGSRHNSRILDYFARAGHPEVHDDETAWCSAFACFCFETSNVKSARTLWARSWAKWGVPLRNPQLGAVVVLTRGDGGHVGLFIRYSDDGRHVLLLGGNQSNKVCYSWFPIERIIAVRWPSHLDYTVPETPTPQPEPKPWTVETTPEQDYAPPDVPHQPPELVDTGRASPPRILVKRRETFDDTLERLRDNGSRIVKVSETIKRFLGGLTLTGLGVGSFEMTSGQITAATAIAAVVVAVAAYLYLSTDKIIDARVEDDMQGLHIGRKYARETEDHYRALEGQVRGGYRQS